MCYKVTQFICVVHMPGLRGWSGFSLWPGWSCGWAVVEVVFHCCGGGRSLSWAGALIPAGLGC